MSKSSEERKDQILRDSNELEDCDSCAEIEQKSEPSKRQSSKLK